MTTHVLFLCPHNAAKSVTAAALVSTAAAEAGLDVSVSTGGTHPDPDVLPIVRSYLESRALPVIEGPRAITAGALATADLIINIGCDRADLPGAQPMRDWQITNFSDNPDQAFADLEAHCAALVRELTSNG